MKIESQVTSLEISKKLKELGVKQESLFYWQEFENQDIRCVMGNPSYFNGVAISAFTVAELGEMLPKTITSKSGEEYTFGCSFMLSGKPYCFYENIYGYFTEQQEGSATEADARGKMLIYLLENKLITFTSDKEEK